MYEKAAKQGHDYAQHNLGDMYINGDGVSKDVVTGCAWVYLSNIDINYVDYCDNLLSQAQMIRAMNIFDELKKQINER